jgi:DNA-directed RNA polymerase subunit RPC12/RpoP
VLHTFDCPKCGGPVSYESRGESRETLGSQETVRCPYCNSSLFVPDELRGQPARVVPISIHVGHPSSLKLGRWIWLLVGIPAFVVLIVVLALVGVLAPLLYSVTRTVQRDADRPVTSRPTSSKEKTVDEDFARVALKFGSEGIGPGMFTDARSIAVDGAGRIYVGEYTGGRIQIFDSAGKFITQWNVGDRKTLLRGLAADRKGTVYVVYGGAIYRYEGETGNLLGQLEYESNGGFDDVTTAADGGVLAARYRNRDDLVRFNSSGQAVTTIRAAISSASGDSELNTRVAIDGSGNIYALGTFNEAVFKFTPDGKFVNRFGGSGDQPGQIRAASAIAVDGKGRVFVSDIKGIQVFDSSGRFLRAFKSEGSASGMVFNDNNELFVAAASR